MKKNLNITVVGTGYVGLVSGACMAEIGHNVTCVDRDAYKIEQLQRGEIPIFEPTLDEWVVRNVSNGRLHFSQELTASLATCDAIFIAVGTPTASDGASADLAAVYDVARSIAPHLNHYTIVVTKSTVPVTTNKKIEEIIRETNPNANFDICSNPEFLREGSAISDFMHSDRIVVGVRSDKAKAVMETLYAPLTDANTPLLVTTPESAEMIKYAANAFLAMKIAFINEVANIAEVTGGDIDAIARGIGMDTRIGSKFLVAGPGFGGSCFPKDTRGFAHLAREHNAPSHIIEAVITSNDVRKHDMATRIIRAMGGNLSGKKIALLGVTFKANTDDMRESVSLDIVPKLLAAGAAIHAHDPGANAHARALLPQTLHWYNAPEETFADADVIILLTEWPQFSKIDLKAAKAVVRQPLLIDLRNFFGAEAANTAGFDYVGIGAAPRSASSARKLRVVA